MFDIIPFELERRIWRLRHESHWTVRRIARHLGLSTTTVYRYLHRNLIRSKQRLRCPRRRVRPMSLSGVYNA